MRTNGRGGVAAGKEGARLVSEVYGARQEDADL